MKEWWELMRTREERDDVAAEAAGRRAARQRPARRQCHHHDRLGHDHHLGGAAHPDPPRHEVLVLGQPGDDGAGPALRHRRAGRLSRPPGRRLRRRRRLHDADGASSSRRSSTSCRSRSSSSRTTSLGQIKWEQMVFLGNPEYGVELQPIDFVKFAEACGGVGFRCEKPDEVRPALEAAFASKKPALVEAVVDPFEPPHARAGDASSRALHFAESLVRGEPHARQDRRDPLPRQGQGTGLSRTDVEPAITAPRARIAAMISRLSNVERRRSIGSRSPPTRFRPTPRSRTAPIAWDSTTLVLVEATAGGDDGPRLLLCRHGDGGADPRPAGRGRPGPRRDGRARRLVGDGRGDPQPRPARASPRWRSRPSTRRSGT